MDIKKNGIGWKVGHGVVHRTNSTDVLSGTTEILCSGDLLMAV